MADKFLVAAGGNLSAANTWSNTGSDQAGGDGKPGAGDDVILDDGSGALAVDENSAALGSLTMTGYADTVTLTNIIDVDGNAVLDGAIADGGGSLQVSGHLTLTEGMTDIPNAVEVVLNGTGNVNTNGVSGGAIEVNTAGTHTQTGNCKFSSITMTAGKYDVGAYGLVVPNTISGTGGTFDFGAGYLELAGGGLDGDGITMDNASATAVGGDIESVDLTGKTALLHLWGTTSGGNTNVTETSPYFIGNPVYVY